MGPKTREKLTEVKAVHDGIKKVHRFDVDPALATHYL